jgi:voltage-gated potassium channel
MREIVKRDEGKSRILRHVFMSLGFVLIVLVVGVAGYIFLEEFTFTEALYMTVITIFTVGFREVRSLDTAGMYFTMLIVVTGVTAMLFFVSSVFEFVLSEFFGIWGRRRMQNSISKLSGHYVICGYGRVGQSVAEELKAQGKEFVVIENNQATLSACIEVGFLAVHGSATENEVLLEAGIMDAAGLVSALPSDADNLYVVLSARMNNPDILLVARADQPDSVHKLEMVGADRVISPHKMAGARMAHLMIHQRVCEFIDVYIGGEDTPDYELAEYKIEEGSGLIGNTVRDAGLREKAGVSILAISKKDQKKFNPNPEPDVVIEKGDLLILIGTSEQMRKVESDQP